MDLYSKLRPGASQHQLVWIGRVATSVMVLVAIAWIPVIRGAQGLYFYLQAMQGYLAPPIFTVFFLGVFFKRMNARGALAALGAGFAMGLFRLAVDTPVTLGMAGYEDGYPQGSFLWIVNNVYFQYYSLLIFLVSAAVMVIVSRITEPPAEDKLIDLTFATLTEEHKRESRASWGMTEVAWSCVTLALILAAYLNFNG
jgi:SSS family solute:Na+ symporter